MFGIWHGLIASIAGIIAVIYMFKVNAKFAGELKTGYSGITYGILSATSAIIALTLNGFEVLSQDIARLSAEILFGVATILITLGSFKMFKVLSSVQKNNLKK